MSWYHIPGNQQDVAVSTRVRLARNLMGYPFPSRLDAAGAKSVMESVGAVLEKNGFIPTDFAEISRGAAGSLVEKRFITPRFVSQSLPMTTTLTYVYYRICFCLDDSECQQVLQHFSKT